MSRKHKVFISYYHHDDQYYKNELIRQNYLYGLFEDYSVHEDEIDDTGKSVERIRQIIRDDYIRDATVLILLCGENTRRRKHIDWEIHAAMFNTDLNPQMGILVINLPTINQWVRAGENEDKALIADNIIWASTSTREDYQEQYPYMPDRIIDNFMNAVPISVVGWHRISNKPEFLKPLVHKAFLRKTTNNYDNSRIMRRNNS